MSSQGWIKLHRKIKNHWIWQDSFYLQLWLDFLMRANHEGKKVLVGKKLIQVNRGSFITSQLKLAEEYKCSRKKIKTFLEMLNVDHMLDQQKNSKYTLITISNYGTYQDRESQEEQQKHTTSTLEEHDEPMSSTAEEHIEHTNKNEKNLNNNNNVKNDKKLINDGRKDRSDDFSFLWIEAFSRFPSLIELKETKILIKKYGLDKVKNAFNESAINGARSLRYIINHLEGTKNSKNNNNGQNNARNYYTGKQKEGYIEREMGKDFSSVVISD